MTRRRFTERQVLETLIRQGAHIPCGCGCERIIKLEDVCKVERDHGVPIALGGPDTPENCTYMRAPCHDRKSDGAKKHLKIDGDKSKIAKAKRLSGETKKPSGRKIQSRGFRNDLQQKYNRKNNRFETVRRT